MDANEAIRKRGQRRWAVAGILVLAAVFTAAMVAAAVDQSEQVGVWARIENKTCHEPNGGGGAGRRTFKDSTCVLDLVYKTPSGREGTVTFHGVNVDRIHHDASGHEVVKVYFASSSSRTAVNPEDRPPLWAWLLFVAFTLVGAGVSVWALVAGTPRAKAINRLARQG